MLLHCARTLGHGGCDGDLDRRILMSPPILHSEPTVHILDTLLFLSASYGLTVVLAFTDDLSTWSLTVSRQ